MNNVSLSLATLLLLPHLAFAKSPTVEAPQLMKYVEFVLDWTSYKYEGEPLPQVKVVEQDLIQIFTYGDYEFAQAEYNGTELPQVNAVYDQKRKTIYISESLDLQDPVTELTLVHEMTHYLQDINGYTDSLDGHLVCTESEAYDIQMLWQKIYGVSLETMTFTYQQSILAATKCMGSKSSAFPSLMDQFDSSYDQLPTNRSLSR